MKKGILIGICAIVAYAIIAIVLNMTILSDKSCATRIIEKHCSSYMVQEMAGETWYLKNDVSYIDHNLIYTSTKLDDSLGYRKKKKWNKEKDGITIYYEEETWADGVVTKRTIQKGSSKNIDVLFIIKD